MASKIKKDSDFYQESLIWMGYRYAIGLAGAIPTFTPPRHTFPVSGDLRFGREAAVTYRFYTRAQSRCSAR